MLWFHSVSAPGLQHPGAPRHGHPSPPSGLLKCPSPTSLLGNRSRPDAPGEQTPHAVHSNRQTVVLMEHPGRQPCRACPGSVHQRAGPPPKHFVVPGPWGAPNHCFLWGEGHKGPQDGPPSPPNSQAGCSMEGLVPAERTVTAGSLFSSSLSSHTSLLSISWVPAPMCAG